MSFFSKPEPQPDFEVTIWNHPSEKGSGNMEWRWCLEALNYDSDAGDALRDHTVKTNGFAPTEEEAEDAANRNLARAKELVAHARRVREAYENRRIIYS